MHVHARLGAERHRGRVGEPIDEPALAKIVVDDEHAIRLQPIADGPERLLGEHVALEPHAREARLHRQRIDQREHDQVVMLSSSCARKCRASSLITVTRGSEYGMIRMMLAAEPDDRRIDFDRIDVSDAMTKRRRDVRARAGAENQDVLKRCRRTRYRATGRSIPSARPAPWTGERCCSPRRPCRARAG